MANESCPPGQIGGGDQQDLNAPTDPSVVTYVQRHNLQDLRPLCAAGLSPSIVTGVIMQLLARHFASPGLIMTENLKQYVFTGDPATNKIRITTNTRFDPKSAGLFPALVIKRGGLKTDRKVMGDRLPVSQDEQDAGVSSYVRFHEGSHQVYVIAESDGEAEDLALECFDYLTFLSPVMVDLFPFHDFQVASIGPLGVLEAMGNQIGIQIQLDYVYEYAWSVQPIAPRLKTVSTTIDT